MKFKKGESGNPKGRPPKHRTLTNILERVGAAKVERDGEQISGKQLMAELLWKAATTGKVTFPGQGEGEAEELSAQDWLATVKFIYGQIDGPPKQVHEHSGRDGKPIQTQTVGMTLDEWQQQEDAAERQADEVMQMFEDEDGSE